MQKHAQGFMNFVREQGVVGLAVGLAIGAAAGDAVDAIVKGLISPIVGFILGGTDLASLEWEIVKKTASSSRELTIGYGMVLQSIITLLATAFVVYQIIHILKMDRLDKKDK